MGRRMRNVRGEKRAALGGEAVAVRLVWPGGGRSGWPGDMSAQQRGARFWLEVVPTPS